MKETLSSEIKLLVISHGIIAFIMLFLGMGIYACIKPKEPEKKIYINQVGKASSAYDYGEIFHGLYSDIIGDIIKGCDMEINGRLVISTEKMKDIEYMLETKYKKLKAKNKALYTKATVGILRLKCPSMEKTYEY